MKNYRELISIEPNIRFGKPCIKGTRISVGDILGWLAAGMTYDEIIEDFPELGIDSIRAALALNADKINLHFKLPLLPLFITLKTVIIST
jgi:uncharacterized protein (DUF433 family)